MAKKGNQISDEEVQLFLSGELDLENSEKLKEIEREVVLRKNTNKEDIELVKRIQKFREVDKIVAENLEAKYPMPEAFSKEIQVAISKLASKKSILSDVAEKSKRKISSIKLGLSSAIGGAALTAIGTTLFFSLQTSVVTRGELNDLTPSSITEDAGWIVFDDFAFKIISLSSSKKGQAKNLINGSEVKIGEEFIISLLPINNVSKEIYYQSNNDETSKKALKENTIYTFSAPKGKDKIIIEIDGKVVKTIELILSD